MTTATLETLHTAWKTSLSGSMSVLKTVEAYRADDSDGKVTTPAVLLDLEDFEEGATQIDNPACWLLRWTFFCLLSNQTATAELAAREMAMTVAGLVKIAGNLGFDNVGEPMRINAQPAALRPGIKGYQCWVVSFEQDFFVDAERVVANLGDFELAHATVDLTDDTPGLAGVDDIEPEQD